MEKDRMIRSSRRDLCRVVVVLSSVWDRVVAFFRIVRRVDGRFSGGGDGDSPMRMFLLPIFYLTLLCVQYCGLYTEIET